MSRRRKTVDGCNTKGYPLRKLWCWHCCRRTTYRAWPTIGLSQCVRCRSLPRHLVEWLEANARPIDEVLYYGRTADAGREGEP